MAGAAVNHQCGPRPGAARKLAYGPAQICAPLEAPMLHSPACTTVASQGLKRACVPDTALRQNGQLPKSRRAQAAQRRWPQGARAHMGSHFAHTPHSSARLPRPCCGSGGCTSGGLDQSRYAEMRKQPRQGDQNTTGFFPGPRPVSARRASLSCSTTYPTLPLGHSGSRSPLTSTHAALSPARAFSLHVFLIFDRHSCSVSSQFWRLVARSSAKKDILLAGQCGWGARQRGLLAEWTTPGQAR
mmetsp:Transcript_107510/g.326814  ORF Transcript_107510/g.326814 Transcript_107510/m.326814 type:complete len:243 (+) Transcript_107510:121-849(+)